MRERRHEGEDRRERERETEREKQQKEREIRGSSLPFTGHSLALPGRSLARPWPRQGLHGAAASPPAAMEGRRGAGQGEEERG